MGIYFNIHEGNWQGNKSKSLEYNKLHVFYYDDIES